MPIFRYDLYYNRLVALIHSLHSSTRCTHPLVALIHSLHSSTRCTHPLVALIHSLHSSTRCTHPLVALIHSLHSSRRTNACEARVFTSRYVLRWMIHRKRMIRTSTSTITKSLYRLSIN